MVFVPIYLLIYDFIKIDVIRIHRQQVLFLVAPEYTMIIILILLQLHIFTKPIKVLLQSRYEFCRQPFLRSHDNRAVRV